MLPTSSKGARRSLALLTAFTATVAMAPLAAAPAEPLPITKADCGPGSKPEQGLQGDVPAADRDSGRSRQGYSCNVERIGSYQGEGAGITSTSYENCGYTGSMFPTAMVGENSGVTVIDASNPRAPRKTASLRAPAFQAGTWESLKANRNSRLLVGAGVPFLTGAGLLAVYDISDCAHPKLLNPVVGSLSAPLAITAHEGGFSPDGKTYWAMGIGPGMINAVDLSDPSHPKVLANALTALENHGVGVSADGNTLYVSHNFGGVSIWDVSAVQRRDRNPQIRKLSQVDWTSGALTQHSIPVTYDDHDYLFTVLEGGSGGVKLVDVDDARKPKVVNELKLEINLPQHRDRALASSSGGGLFAYESHYCAADRPANPTALACGWTSSGVRVFDVRNPQRVKEIAYFNPPAQTGRQLDLLNSAHTLASVIGVPFISSSGILESLREGQFDPRQARSNRSGRVIGDLSTDWCFSPPEWRGDKLYVGCSDSGFQVLQLTNDVYTPPVDQQSHVGS